MGKLHDTQARGLKLKTLRKIELAPISFVMATPIAWLAMNKWLQNFAYRNPIDFGVFVWSGLLVLGIAWLTVSYQSFKAASTNPVKALRYE